MWGKNPADKDSNPYATAEFKDVQAWMLDAVTLMEAFQRKPGQLGVVIAFADRREFSETQSKYFKDPHFEPEIRFLQAQNRGRYKKLYDRYHRRITSPLAYCLPEILWKLNAAVEGVDGTAVDVRFDRFADARGIDAKEVLQVTRTLAGYDRITSLREIDTHYNDSPLCQAADLMAWTHNRFFTEQSKAGGSSDAPFDRIFSQMHRRLKVLNGGPFHTSAHQPASSTHDLCVAYALARASVADRHPEFAEEHLVSVHEFHQRHVATAGKASGVSVLTEEARHKLLSGVPK